MGEVIFALDDERLEAALGWVNRLKDRISWFKVGSALFTRYGPKSILAAREAGANRIFLDLKFHDIPTTVLKALQGAAELGVDMVNLHILSGQETLEMCSAWVRSLPQGSHCPLVVGVTVLSSLKTEDLQMLGFAGPREKLLLELASLGKQASLDGVVASGEEIGPVRKAFPKDFLIVCPGVFVGDEMSLPKDQKNSLHANEAFSLGADFVVLGRSLRQCQDPQGILATLAR